MDRADRQGLGLALAGHLALLLALVFGLFSPKPVRMPQADTMTVQLVQEVAPRSAAPKASRKAPAPPKAEEEGKPEDAAPPPPSPKPTPPKPSPPAPPKPTPPKPAPAKPAPAKPTPPKPIPPQPTPPKPTPSKPEPTPKPEPKPKPAPKPKPVPPKPVPPKPTKPKPAPEKPTEQPAPEKPAKAAPTKAAAAKAAKDTQATKDTKEAKDAKDAKATDDTKSAKSGKSAKASKSDDRDFTLPSDLRAAGTGKSGKAAKRTGSLLGSDFSKDIAAAAKEAKGSAPQAAEVGQRALAGLGAAIIAQVKPCYVRPSGGAGSQSILTVLDIRMNADGTVVTTSVTDHDGVNDANRAYVRQMDDAARRAVLRCAPLKLPADLYDNGWKDILITFRPESLGG